MLLSEYIYYVMHNDTYRTKSQLQLDLNLAGSISALRDISEQGIREWGMMLHWADRSGNFRTGQPFEGSRTAVGWNPQALQSSTYIGTVHSHPYEKKLGKAVGFSMGDFVFFGENAPQFFPIGVNFVVSCDTLYLAVYRACTRRLISTELKMNLDTDEDESEDYLIRKLGGRGDIDRIMLDVNIADQEGRIDESAEIERALYDYVSGYNHVRVAANKQMMRNAAQVMRFELYWGRLGGTLHLKSARAYH